MASLFSFGYDEQDLPLDDDLENEDTAGPHSYVAEDVELDGVLNVKRVIEVSGAFRGTLASKSTVVVKPGGLTEGEMDAFNVVIEGTVRGRVNARKQLEILGGGKFVGSLAAQPEAIVLSEFGVFGKDEAVAEAFFHEFARPKKQESDEANKTAPNKSEEK